MRLLEFCCAAVLIALGGVKIFMPSASMDLWPTWYVFAVHISTAIEIALGLAFVAGRRREALAIVFLIMAVSFTAFALALRPEGIECGCLGALIVSRYVELALAGGLLALAGSYAFAVGARPPAAVA